MSRFFLLFFIFPLMGHSNLTTPSQEKERDDLLASIPKPFAIPILKAKAIDDKWNQGGAFRDVEKGKFIHREEGSQVLKVWFEETTKFRATIYKYIESLKIFPELKLILEIEERAYEEAKKTYLQYKRAVREYNNSGIILAKTFKELKDSGATKETARVSLESPQQDFLRVTMNLNDADIKTEMAFKHQKQAMDDFVRAYKKIQRNFEDKIKNEKDIEDIKKLETLKIDFA